MKIFSANKVILVTVKTVSRHLNVQVRNKNKRLICSVCSKLTVKNLLRCYVVSAVNFERIKLKPQPAFTCSKFVSNNKQWHRLVSILLILNRFHTFFCCFYFGLWKNKYRLRRINGVFISSLEHVFVHFVEEFVSKLVTKALQWWRI